ncbi:STAS domain-containing protein [Streptacidiphilus melanogenes]|uniref:STAS domain-containing protein n=1 Tax=Streptacidiphilus melanogenes TaxID=411235 RepID=UPI0005AB7390|nr:STAS domain-containing protein [Streptacidiphilus melanogenes]
MNGQPERFTPRCTAEDASGVLVYHLAGDLDFDTPDVLAFDKPLADFRAVVIDLAQVTFFSSTALNALLGLRLRAEPLGTPVHLAALPRATARVLELTDATALFPIHPDLHHALAELTPDPPPA